MSLTNFKNKESQQHNIAVMLPNEKEINELDVSSSSPSILTPNASNDSSQEPEEYDKERFEQQDLENQKLRASVNNKSGEDKTGSINTNSKTAQNSNNNNTPAIQFRPATKAPRETLKAVYAAGRYKAGLRLDVLSIQCFMAGIYIASACQLLISVGGGILGASVFPGGLMAVVFTSAELFTGDALIFVASVLGREVKVRSLLRNWSVAWCCNFIGSITWAFFLGYLSNSLIDLKVADVAIAIANKKAHSSLISILIRGIGANFMVCVAIWQATCAEEVAGKVLAIWFPVMAFVAMGFDHCVANMYFIPMGMMLGADISVGRMFSAILVATVGNTIGGGIFVGAIYWYVFDSMQSFNVFRARIRQGMDSMGKSKRASQ